MPKYADLGMKSRILPPETTLCDFSNYNSENYKNLGVFEL